MKEAPSEPLPLRKPSKNGMRLKLEISLPSREAFDQGKQLRFVLLKIQWTSANIPLLIDFGWRLKPLGPLQGKPKRNPLDHRLIDQVGCDASRLLANGNSECIAEMTDHLMCGHSAPLARAIVANLFETENDGGFVLRVGETSHGAFRGLRIYNG